MSFSISPGPPWRLLKGAVTVPMVQGWPDDTGAPQKSEFFYLCRMPSCRHLCWIPASSVHFSCSLCLTLCDPMDWLQHTRPLCPSPTPRVYSNSCPSSRWCHPTISSFVVSFSCCLNLSQHQGLFQWVSSSHQVAEVLEFQLQHQSFRWKFRTDFL